MSKLVAKLLLTVAVISSINAGPLHASCRIKWIFGIPCSDVKQKIVNQFEAWKGPENCKSGGEKCLYTLTSQSDTEIKGIHETPVKHYKDDLTFTLKSSGDICNVDGYSTSEIWYAILDSSTNYCNLHNLITGSGLDKVPGYTETTSDSVCTQYSSADCEKY
ncbi:hypothetical protein ACJMK2_023217 [Sinanodonta woodiana]|uniref:Uncharacterized protein n=1 Tax=Sinanodonta woodiana TaxID=1069815 RepID=A0ABD3T4A7_SINWO